MQPSVSVFREKCSENMQQIYGTPMWLSWIRQTFLNCLEMKQPIHWKNLISPKRIHGYKTKNYGSRLGSHRIEPICNLIWNTMILFAVQKMISIQLLQMTFCHQMVLLRSKAKRNLTRWLKLLKWWLIKRYTWKSTCCDGN